MEVSCPLGPRPSFFCLQVLTASNFRVIAETGEPVAESPYPLRIVAAKPYPRKSSISLHLPGSAATNELVEFEVQARDTYGNRFV